MGKPFSPLLSYFLIDHLGLKFPSKSYPILGPAEVCTLLDRVKMLNPFWVCALLFGDCDNKEQSISCIRKYVGYKYLSTHEPVSSNFN